jgi:proteasome assembly chaperone (PAC2) family protein
LYEWRDRPDLDSPVMVMVLDGWIDAGLAAANAASVIVDELDLHPIAQFDSDALLDFRARRPVMRLVNGINTEVSWPTTDLFHAKDAVGNDVLLLLGAEPDHAWRAFSQAAVDLALDLGARMVIGLGAYPAPVPHTRPPRIACTATSEELASQGFVRSSIEVPIGVQGLIERVCANRGVPAIGLWAQVPHYVAAMPYPAAALALLAETNRIGDLAIPLGLLDSQANATRSRIDELISQNPEHEEMVRQLEGQADASGDPGMQMTSGDELAAELERFLREQPEG